MFYSNFSNFGFGYRAINHSMRRDELVKSVQTIIREKIFVMTKFSKNLFFTSFFARPEKFSRRLQKINFIIRSLVTVYIRKTKKIEKFRWHPSIYFRWNTTNFSKKFRKLNFFYKWTYQSTRLDELNKFCVGMSKRIAHLGGNISPELVELRVPHRTCCHRCLGKIHAEICT